jgi:hypothetical protein
MRRVVVGCMIAAFASATAGAGAAPERGDARSLGTAGGPCCSFWHGYVALAGGRGGVIAAWSDPAKRRIELAVTTTESQWRRLRPLRGYGAIALGVSREGRVVLASAKPRIQVRTARLPQLRWSKPRALGRGAFDELIADADDHGRAAVVWQSKQGGRLRVYGAVAPAFGRVRLDGGSDPEGPIVVRNYDGRLTVAWARCVERRGCAGTIAPHTYRIEARSLSPAGRWSARSVIRSHVELLNRSIRYQHALFDDYWGGVTYAWESSTWPAQDTLAAVRREHGGTQWLPAGPIEELAGKTWQTRNSVDNLYDGNLAAATNVHGDALVSWIAEETNGASAHVGLAFRARGAAAWRSVPLPPELEGAAAPDSSGYGHTPRFAITDWGSLSVLALVRRPGTPAALVAGSSAAPGEQWTLTTLETFGTGHAVEARRLVTTGDGTIAVWTRPTSRRRVEIRTSFPEDR